jgi:hypothetical protein
MTTAMAIGMETWVGIAVETGVVADEIVRVDATIERSQL